MPIRAFLFDFDGLILDTETASRAGWQWLYREHGHELPPEKWSLMVGTVGGWDPWGHLEELVGSTLDRETLNERRYAHELSLIEAEELRPRHLGLSRCCGTPRHQAGDRLECVAPLDRHAPGAARARVRLGRDRHRRSRQGAREAAGRRSTSRRSRALGVDAGEAVAFEDSPNGALGAKRAGIYVVGIPNSVTRDLDLEGAADLVVDSLADLPPDELLARLG